MSTTSRLYTLERTLAETSELYALLIQSSYPLAESIYQRAVNVLEALRDWQEQGAPIDMPLAVSTTLQRVTPKEREQARRISVLETQLHNLRQAVQEHERTYGLPSIEQPPASTPSGTIVPGAGTGTNNPWCPNRTYDWHAWYVEENDSVSASLEKLDTAGWEIFSITPYHNPMKPQFVTTQIITRRPVTDAH